MMFTLFTVPTVLTEPMLHTPHTALTNLKLCTELTLFMVPTQSTALTLLTESFPSLLRLKLL